MGVRRSETPLRRPPRVMTLMAAIALIACVAAGACSRNQYTKVTRTDGSTAIGTLVTMRPDVVVLQTRQGRIEIRRSDVKSLDVPTISEIAEIEGAQTDPGSMARNAAATGDPTAKNGEHPPGGDGSDPGGPGGGPGTSGSENARDGRGGPGSGGASGRGSASDPGSGARTGAQSYARGDSAAGQDAKDGTPASSSAEGGARPGVAMIPAGTAFTVTFDAPLGSDTSRVEEDVTATLTAAIVAGGTRLLPAGAVLRGRVVEATPAKAAGGRGRLAIRFHTLAIGSRTSEIHGPTTALVAPVFTRDDKRKVGIGAAAGAVLGGIVSKTKKAVGIGAAAGAGGTAAAVGVRNELRVARGAKVRLQFTQPVPVSIPTQ
jgi:hypothetical protein